MAEQSFGFFRAGGVEQVILKNGADVEALATLDKKLWVALACPTTGTEIDDKTFELIDTDKDGRLRPPEVLAAIAWTGRVFKNLDILFEKGGVVPLSALDTADDEGKAVLASAKRILKDRDKKEAKSIELEDVTAMQEVFAQTRFNGDGIVPADAADDDALKKIIEDVIVASGSVVDRSGKPGVDRAIVDRFFTEAGALLAWEDESKVEGVLALGDATPAAEAALLAVEAKIDDYFTRCRIAAFDGRSAELLDASDADLESLAEKAISKADEDVVRLPLARVDPATLLPLEGAINPAWAERLAAFREATVKPIVGDKPGLGEGDFAAIQARLAGYRAWQTKKPALDVEKIGLARVREIATTDHKAEIHDLIERDAALEAEYAKISLVEKAIRLRRDLLVFLRNYVNFADFYGRKRGIFQAGTLFLDGRSCDLCIRVNDPAKHAALAGLAKAYLAYCNCSRVGATGPEKMTIVAAFTAGDVDNLMVGRNGVFYDRKGNDWDATIASLVENPISVRQAFWSPYKRLLRMIEEQVAKRAADKEKESHATMDSAALAANGPPAPTLAGAPPAPGAAPAPGAPGTPPSKGVDVGTVAALGVAVAGISSFFGLMFGKFVDLGFWMPLGVLALLLAISGPSMLIAWLKLRQRNLGPILDASGWAVNAMCKINVPFGGSLTQVRELPKGASRAIDDPFAEKPTHWARYLVLALALVLAVAWPLGKLDGWLPEKARAETVLHRMKPDAPSAPAASALPAASAAPAAK